jgi:hypothetical protein
MIFVPARLGLVINMRSGRLESHLDACSFLLHGFSKADLINGMRKTRLKRGAKAIRLAIDVIREICRRFRSMRPENDLKT